MLVLHHLGHVTLDERFSPGLYMCGAESSTPLKKDVGVTPTNDLSI